MWKSILPQTIVLIVALLPGVITAAEAQERPDLTFCCSADNDLYRVLDVNGTALPRFDDPARAIRAADEGAGVLILADGYPQKTTDVDDALFELAAEKELRLYVEFPGQLPGIDVGKPQGTKVERAVIRSDFFGAKLARLRILAIGGLQFVPVEVEESHIVAARVAGFDTAVYGLPETTYPILFEHRDREILVATTKLSHFVTGRYAPTDAWRTLWQGVLRWLCRGQEVPPLSWTPMVRASYGPDDPLPADIEERALRRGAEWFIRSKLLLHPSREEEIARAVESSGGLAPTPPPEAPVGDGSLGILEAPLSMIQHDGRQLQGVARRGDCHGESAMAMAFGGKIFSDARKSQIAENLLDFWYFTSDACKRERGDPNHGAYGLIAWGVTTPAWYVANYGDDNARLMMGTLAAAAIRGEDRWDEPMMRCLLANLRTTGQLGFRSDRLDLGPLGQHGWQHFFRRRVVSYSPHMEAYLWACYLWAYHQTHEPLFLDRAKTALRMTMAVHTDGWRWTNGLAQERARILLPLAWLVRVEDTPEHRGWLRTAAEGLVGLQADCGAIREELGLPGEGMFPPPASNAAYGGHEASLIQQNGDPVCDLLYTTNFAFLGLHEAAAATGDPFYRRAEDKLAEFLCRIQVRSEKHPSLDGGWFRAFDFHRWEPWGSNADAGWGAWAIESGWTQGWITAVLAMRQMDTSLWDLTEDSRIERHFEKLRKEMLPEEAIAALKPKTVKHLAVGKSVKLVARPSASYQGGGPAGLSDGCLGLVDHASPEWLGFHGLDLQATVDLGQPTPIAKVAANFLQSTGVGIFLPGQVEFAVSDDGSNFRTIATIRPETSVREPGPLTKTLSTGPLNLRTRYVRVRAKNVGVIPDWHTATGLKAWLFVDEILVTR